MMKKQKLIAITVAAVTALTPIAGSNTVYAKLIPSDTDIIVSDEAENTDTGEDVDVDKAMKESIDKTTAINNAVSMTDKIAKVNKDKNVMFSPASLNFALGMLAEGADGETKEVLQKYLGTENFAEYAKWYMDKIKYYNEEENYGYKSKLKIADAVWADNNMTLQDKFKQSIQDNFNGEIQNLDFSDKENSCNTINAWCDKNTEGLIPEIITPDAISENTGLCLTNSLYFESGWSGDPWEVSKKKEKFGEKEETKYMTSEGDRYYENDKATAFARYYVNGLSFIGILPKNEGYFTLEDLDIEGLLKSEPKYDEVQCKMPKLNFETSATLNDMLSDLGLENIFSDKADFSGISEQNTKVDTILQKTKLELDQNGTKAAAVTAAIMECMSALAPDPVVKEVNLDRPFAFLIYDDINGEMLFTGKVVTLDK